MFQPSTRGILFVCHRDPPSSRHIPAVLPASLRRSPLRCKCLLPKPLKNNTDSESGCVAALRSSGRVFFIIFILVLSCCCPLEVIQLQCMTQGFQIGTTGHPPEWHVFLRAETRDDEILSAISVYTRQRRWYVTKYTWESTPARTIFTPPPHCGGARQKELQQRRASGGG